MRYTIRQYAEALASAVASPTIDIKKLAKKFFFVLLKNKDLNMLQVILLETEKLYLKENNLKKVRLEVSGLIKDNLKEEIKNILGGRVLIRESINNDLGAGLRIFINDYFLIDASAKNIFKEFN